MSPITIIEKLVAEANSRLSAAGYEGFDFAWDDDGTASIWHMYEVEGQGGIDTEEIIEGIPAVALAALLGVKEE